MDGAVAGRREAIVAEMTDVPDARRSVLSGIRVLDIGHVLAGPLVATFLGDFGADVIKVEPPGGDPLRVLSSSVDSVPLWWAAEARNKRSIVIDLRTDAGRDLLLDLVGVSDVVIENFRPGVLERMGIGPERMFAANGRLILARVSGYGQTGPYSGRPGFGKAVEALAGVVDLSGFADGPPVHAGFPMADVSTAVMGAFAVMLALYGRDAKGSGSDTGEIIDLGIYETPLRMISSLIPEYDKLKLVPRRAGNRQPALKAFCNTYRAQDGRWVSINGATFTAAKKILDAVGGDASFEMLELKSMDDILEHFEEVDKAIAVWIAGHDADQVVEEFARAGAVAALVYNIEDVFGDPHIAARENIVRVEDELIGEVAVPSVIPRLEKSPGSIRRRAPRLGEDTDAVLGEFLGLSSTDIANLRAQRVVA